MTDQTKLALLSDSPTGDTVRSAQAFAKGGTVEPTQAQKDAGNYRKLHTTVHGLRISIENAKGSKRSGVAPNGKKWSVRMPAHYGYVKGTEGADGDHVDVYLGPSPGNHVVYVVDQIDLATGKFDEHKALVGFPSKEAALAAYRAGFSDGKGGDRIGGVRTFPIHKFKEWLAAGARTRPATKAVKSFEEGGPVEADEPDDEGAEAGPWDDYKAKGEGEEAGPWDDYKEPEKSSAAGAFARGAAKGVVPALGAIPAATTGAEIGMGIGAMGGPAAPVTVPLGGVIGGLGGAYLGSKIAGDVQDWFLDKLGLSDHAQDAADEEEHPYAHMAGALAPNVAAFNPAKVASTLGSRVLPATIGAGVEAAQEKASGQDIDPTKLALAGGAMALMNKPTQLGSKLMGIGETAATKGMSALPPATQAAIQAGKARAGDFWSGKATEGQPGRPDMKPSEETPGAPEGPDTQGDTQPDQSMAPDFQGGEPVDQGHPVQDMGEPETMYPETGHGPWEDYQENTQETGTPEGATQPGTAPADNVALPAANDNAAVEATQKTPEFIQQSKKEATPARNNSSSVGTAHEQAAPDTTLATVGSNPDHPIGVGSEKVYAKTAQSNVDPTTPVDTVPTATTLDPARMNIAPDIEAAMGGKPQEQAPAPAPEPGAQGATQVGPEQPPVPDTGIQAGHVTDTVTQLRQKGLDKVADAVEKNPHVAQTARRILQDLTQEPQAGGLMDEAKARQARRLMERSQDPNDIKTAQQLLEEAQDPAAKGRREAAEAVASQQRAESREKSGQVVQVGDNKITAASEVKARNVKRAADAAQSAFDKFPPSDNISLGDRLKAALAHAHEENLGQNAVKRASEKETPAQQWLRSARKLMGPEGDKVPTAAQTVKFLGDERLIRAGGSSAKLAGDTNRIEGEIANNKRRITMDPAAKAMADWMDTLSPSERETLVNEGITPEGAKEAEWESADTPLDPDTYEQEITNGKRPGLDSYDRMMETASQFWGDEAGGVNVQKLVQALKGTFGTKARKTAVSYIARDPVGPRQEYARSLSDGLHTLQNLRVEHKVQILKEIDAMPSEFKDPKAQEEVYNARESGTTGALPKALKDAYDTYLKPKLDENDGLFAKIEQLSPGTLGPKIANHLYRIAKGLHPDYGDDPVAGTGVRGLSKTASMLKERQFLAIEDAAGNRKVVSPTATGYSEWDNGTATPRPNANFEPEAGTTFTDHTGQQMTVKNALTPEIEAHAKFSNGAKAEYYHNAIVSTMETNQYLGDVLRNLQYIESLKADPKFNEFATQDGKKARENDWKQSVMPQMKNWYMANQLRYAFDDFAKPGIKDDGLDRVRALSQGVTKLLFWMPTAHMMNVGAHWFVNRGWNWITPEGWRSAGVNGARAIKSVLQQDELQTELRKAGYGGVYGSVITNEFLNQMAKGAGMAMMKNQSKWDPIARVMGYSTKDLVDGIYKWSSHTMWAANDMMLTQAILEKMDKGMSMKEAISRAEQHIPNYRIPTTIMGGGTGARAFAQFMGDPLFMSFGRYHYGVFNSYAHIIKDAVQGTGEERMEAIGKMFAMGVLAYAVYPALNKMAAIVTGNKDAEMHPRGPIAIPHHLVRALQGKEDLMQGARSTLTLSPLLATGMETLQNKDWTGRNIMEPGDVARTTRGTVAQRIKAAGRVAVQQGEHLAKGLVSPYGTAAQALDAKRSLPGAVRDQALDIRNPSQAAVRYEHTGPQKNIAAARSRENKGRGPMERLYNQVTR